MKLFHIGDVLTITTGRLVSPRHIEGVYDILNFMTGDSLFTHQLPRAARECKPWLLAQYPQFDSPEFTTMSVGKLIEGLDYCKRSGESVDRFVAVWLASQAAQFTGGITEIPVEPLGSDMHTRIDPIEELEAMVGKDRVITVAVDGGAQ